jgi:phosphate transport system substrate-binding protein
MAALANDLGACFSPKAASYEVTNQLTADVESDPYGIGYVGIGFRDNTKPLGIVVDCATGPSGAPHRFVYSPNDFNIKTEEYPLSRRLYLYTRGKPTNVLASGLVEFAQSKDAGETIRKTGFYDSTIMEAEFSTLGDRFVSMISAVGTNDMQTHDFLSDILFATRLSTTLRFADKAAKLDNKALDDILSLADALNHTYKGRQFIIAGFSDSMDDPERARQLSADRAVAVATALMAQHVTVFRGNVHAYGAAAPVACEDSEAGRVLNRRVEIWVK